ncbi:hypothetical protein JW711_00230 [Candidatus Woesearchaeota archaeon]|nr:hypothetical protein [Candidatus Woesearchaeota archaeon]
MTSAAQENGQSTPLRVLESIIQRHSHPIIGIIGATDPLPGYDDYDNYMLGYHLREAIGNQGSLFTGGVLGAGRDSYEGIVQYCTENNVDDRFFVVLPEKIEPPQEYLDLAKKTSRGTLHVEPAGANMEERRSYIGAIADLIVVINGARGTLDEALKGLIFGKPILSLEGSGGAADALVRLHKGEKTIPPEMDRSLIRPYDTVMTIANAVAEETHKYSRGR